ncbi:MAG: hypothetical protein AAGA66_10215 [Bacteroidota bacterium]
MRKTLLSMLLSVACMMLLLAQAPEKFNYQALARDSLGNPLVNQNISVKFSMRSSSVSGPVRYSEVHYGVTDNLGMFSLIIGSGTVVSGDFTTIDWGNDSHFLQVELDPNGGTTYALLGAMQLLSVPYALHAGSMDGVTLTDNHEVRAGSSATISIGNTHPDHASAIGNNIMGQNAGSASMSGPYNVIIGQQAGQSATTGQRNVFVGSFSGNKNTTGEYNVYVGTDAGSQNQTGGSNTLIGNQAGALMTGSLNTAVGRWAGYNNKTGRNNVFMGVNAGAHNNGFGNAFMGSSTGWRATGSRNVFLGQGVGQFSSSHGSVMIGYQVGNDETRDDVFILGNGPDSTDYLMTGDFARGHLHVRGELATGSGVRFSDGTLQTTALVSPDPVWSKAGDAISYKSGNVGIGTDSPTEKLTVNGNIRLNGGILFDDGTLQVTAAVSGDTARWVLDSVSNLSYTHGKIGIGTGTPSEQLTVDGKIETTGGLKFGDGSVQTTAFTSTNGSFPSGGIIMWSGNTPPIGWLLCDGTNGTPDLRGRFIAGYDPNVDDYDQPGNLSGGGAIMGETGGADEVALTVSQMPGHSHGNRVFAGYMNSESAANTFPAGNTYAASAFRGMRRTTSNHINTNEIVAAGGNEAHENRPSFYVLAFIMKQ